MTQTMYLHVNKWISFFKKIRQWAMYQYKEIETARDDWLCHQSLLVFEIMASQKSKLGFKGGLFLLSAFALLWSVRIQYQTFLPFYFEPSKNEARSFSLDSAAPYFEYPSSLHITQSVVYCHSTINKLRSFPFLTTLINSSLLYFILVILTDMKQYFNMDLICISRWAHFQTPEYVFFLEKMCIQFLFIFFE
jgi:hypothetical protein